MSAATDPLVLPLALNLVAVGVGALGGAVRAGEDERTDIVGVATLATAMGFGGGIARDLLLGYLPPATFRDARYLLVAGLAALVGALFLYYLRKLGTLLWALDALTIGLFASVGTNAALLAGLGFLPAVLVGTIASVGGLIAADLLQGRASSIMYVGPPNAAAGLAGAAAYALVDEWSGTVGATLAAVVVAVVLRLSGRFFHVTVPQPRKRAYELTLRRTERKGSRRALRKGPPSRDDA